MALKRAIATILVTLLGGFAVLLQASPTAAAAGALPAGKSNYVVTIGNMATTSGVVKTDGWVRLAKYQFTASTSTITQTFWFWSHQNIVGRTASGVSSTGCTMVCSVEVPTGFQDAGSSYPRTLSGSYTYDPATHSVVVTWSSGSIERWTIGDPGTSIVAMHLRSSNYGATEGQGFGSNASATSGANIASVVATVGGTTLLGDSYSNANGTSGVSLGAAFNVPAAPNLCNSRCAEWIAPSSAKGCIGGTADSIRYRLISSSTTDLRKNGYQHYCRSLNGADTTCYTGGLHAKAMLQVIDDAGIFRGWVGIEAPSLASNAPGTGYLATFFYTNAPA